MSLLPKILGIGIVGVLIFILISFLAGSMLISPAPLTNQLTPPDVTEVDFNSANGSISGWLAQVENPRATLLLLHGIRSNKTSMLARIKLARSLGLTSLAIDLQAHGQSEGTEITFGHRESLDVQASIQYLKAISNEPIFVVGVSLGGAAAILSEPPLEVSGYILEAVYPNITTAISNRLAMRFPLGELATPLLALQLQPRLGISLDQLSPMLGARKVTAPILILNGSADAHTTPQDAKNLYQAFKGDKQIEFFHGATHVDLQAFDPEHYRDVLSTFIAKQISVDP